MYLPNNRTQLDAVPAQASKQAAHDSLRGFPRVRLFGALFCCLALTGCPEWLLFADDDDDDDPPAAAPAPGFTPVGGLNDTGITLCGDYAFDDSGSHQNNLDCAAVNATATTAGTDGDGDPVPAGQDAHFGRDAQALAGTLTKTGAGAAGFDFSKVCNSGQTEGEGDCPANPPLGTGANDWACTRDNVSGLIWEVKVNDNTQLRHQNHSYSWYNTDPATNGGSNGTQSGGSCNGDCDTQGFVTAVNAATLCGATDWRLPSATELLSIAHRGAVNPAIDTTYFPNTISSNYWSSSPYAGFSSHAWFVNFNDGRVFADFKSFFDGFPVRLVRAGQ